MSADIRWSYDSRTGELDVWDSKNGRISHYDRCGQEGYQNCAQGRLVEVYGIKGRKKVLHSYSATIYGDRPFVIGEEEEKKAETLRNKAKQAVESYLEPYPVHWQLTF